MICGWIGTPSLLHPVWSTPAMSVTPSVERSYQTTLGGRRFVRHAARGHREWSVEAAGGFTDEIAAVQWFASGAWGVGPWWWFSPWAVGTNMLTPSSSLLEYASLESTAVSAGAVRVSDRNVVLPRSAVLTGTTSGVARTPDSVTTPFPAGEAFTAAMYVSPGQQLRVRLLNGSGGTVESYTSPPAVGVMERVSVSGTPPAAGTRLRLDVIGSGQIAGASLSLTGSLRPWAVGDGCEKAVVDSESRDVRVVTDRPWADQSFTVREVG